MGAPRRRLPCLAVAAAFLLLGAGWSLARLLVAHGDAAADGIPVILVGGLLLFACLASIDRRA